MIAMIDKYFWEGKEGEGGGGGGSKSCLQTRYTEQNRLAIGAEATALLRRNRPRPGAQPAAKAQACGWTERRRRQTVRSKTVRLPSGLEKAQGACGPKPNRGLWARLGAAAEVKPTPGAADKAQRACHLHPAPPSVPNSRCRAAEGPPGQMRFSAGGEAWGRDSSKTPAQVERAGILPLKTGFWTESPTRGRETNFRKDWQMLNTLSKSLLTKWKHDKLKMTLT